MIEVEGPDGNIFEFPDGTSDETMSKALRDYYSNQSQKPTTGPAPTAQDQPSESFGRMLQYSGSNALRGWGNTLDAIGADDWGNTLRNTAAAIKPEGYTPAGQQFDVMSPSTWAYAPRAIGEGAIGLGSDLVAGAAGSAVAGPVGGALAFGASNAGRNFGDNLENRMRADGQTMDDARLGDYVAAGVSSATQAALDRFGVGKALNPVTKGAGLAALRQLPGQVVKAGAWNAGAGAAGSLVDQTGRTLGTDHGFDINGKEIANAAALSGAAGAAGRALGGARDVVQSARLSDIDPASGTRIAKMIKDSGHNADDPAASFKAVRSVEINLRENMSTAYDNARPALEQLPTDTQTAIKGMMKRVSEGIPLTQEQFLDTQKRLFGEVKNKAGDTLVATIKDMNTLNQIKNLGNMNTAKGTFAGGLAETDAGQAMKPSFTKLGTSVAAPWLAGQPAVAALLPGVVGSAAAYAPHLMGGMMLGHYGLRAADAAMGLRNPLGEFTQRFDGVRPTPPLALSNEVARERAAYGDNRAYNQEANAAYRQAQADYNRDYATGKRLNREIDQAAKADAALRRSQEEAAWREQNASPLTKQRQTEFDRARRQAGMTEPTAAQKARQEDAMWRTNERADARAADVNGPPAIKEALAARDAEIQNILRANALRRLLEQQAANATPIDGAPSAQPKASVRDTTPPKADPTADARAKAQKADDAAKARAKVDETSSRTRPEGDTYNYEGIAHPIPPGVENVHRYIAGLRRNQDAITRHVVDSFGSGIEDSTKRVIVSHERELRTARTAADARNIIERIIKQSDPSDADLLRQAYGDSFFNIWKKKDRGE